MIGKVVFYGPEYGLSQRFCCPDFNGRNVQDLQDANGPGRSGQVRVSNDLSGVPGDYGQVRGELPALWKVTAHCMNPGRAIPSFLCTHCAGLPCA